MNTYHYIAVTFLLLSNYLIIRRCNSYFTPYTLISISFFLPLLFSNMRLSGLQSESWHPETVIVISMALMSWLFYPFVICMTNRALQYKKYRINLNINNLSKHYNILCVFLAASYVLLFFLENYILSGVLIPIAYGGDVAHMAHTKTLPVINVLTRGLPLIMVFMVLWYLKTKSKLVLIASVILFILPLTRGSRMDSVVSLFSILVILGESVYSLGGKKVIMKYIVILIVISSVFSFVGFKRAEFTADEYSYAKNIKFRVNDGSGILAAIYGNFSLPFENFDRLVRANLNKSAYGKFSMMPIVNTFFNFSKYTEMYSMDDIFFYDDPVSAAGVSSSLAYFYLDYGSYWSILPMFVVMSLWLYLYRNIYKNIVYLSVYALYSGYFALAAFQPLMLNGATYRRILFMMVLFAVYGIIKNINKIQSVSKY